RSRVWKTGRRDSSSTTSFFFNGAFTHGQISSGRPPHPAGVLQKFSATGIEFLKCDNGHRRVVDDFPPFVEPVDNHMANLLLARFCNFSARNVSSGSQSRILISWRNVGLRRNYSVN